MFIYKYETNCHSSLIIILHINREFYKSIWHELKTYKIVTDIKPVMTKLAMNVQVQLFVSI